MNLKKLILPLMCAVMLASCGKEIKFYRIYDELVVSFTEALSDRKLLNEDLIKADDGKTITEASYTYKSNDAANDKVNYLYYLLNNYNATFLSDDTVAIDSKDMSFAVIVKVTENDNSFTVNVTKRDL